MGKGNNGEIIGTGKGLCQLAGGGWGHRFNIIKTYFSFFVFFASIVERAVNVLSHPVNN
jgi:hypothetical protein